MREGSVCVFHIAQQGDYWLKQSIMYFKMTRKEHTFFNTKFITIRKNGNAYYFYFYYAWYLDIKL